MTEDDTQQDDEWIDILLELKGTALLDDEQKSDKIE
jgi:hypothetical protein